MREITQVCSFRSLIGAQAMRLLSVCLLAGCTTFDPLDQRGETVNRNAADYADNAILLNIIRATRQEPLTFLTITGLDGTESATATGGLPTLTLGPKGPGNYGFGPNSVGRGNSNTYHASVVDDPASFAALMAPVNPAVIAFLMRQGYTTPLLFFLLTSEIREVQVDPVSGEVLATLNDYIGDPSNESQYGNFIGKMASLLVDGLVAQVDATAFPAGKVLPASRLCMDAAAKPPVFAAEIKTRKSPALDPALCERTAWIEADTTSSGSASGSGGDAGQAAGLTSLGVTRDGSLWAEVAAKDQLIRVTPDGKVIQVNLPKALTPVAPPKRATHLAAFEFQDSTGRHYQIFLRSTYGAYSFIGSFYRANHSFKNLLPVDGAGSSSLIDLTVGQTTDCFAEAAYRGRNYCIPQEADNSKQLFTVLHMLQQLQTTEMAKSPSEKLSRATIANIYVGLAEAGLGDFKITSLHLTPGRPRSLSSAAADPSDSCHSQLMPNGQWIIVCD
jgi:hypothetical protein